MKKLILLFISAIISFSFPAVGQENQIKRLPEVKNQFEVKSQKNYSDYDHGFWFSAELSAGYSCRILHSNFGFAELDATAGYRFSEFIRIGAGIGARSYFDNDKVRYRSDSWGFPLYLNVRGNFIPTFERSVVPYYSVDMGGTIRDGFLMRPTIGVRIGQKRSAMLIGLGYVGQHLKSYEYNNLGLKSKKGRFVSFISLRLGYEF